MSGWPRITLVTPVRDGARFLEEAIDSVVGQGYPDLEYVIVDGGSTDGTLDIIRRHERHLAAWISEPDRGMYDALNKGFARSSGEVMGWLSATDLLHEGSLFVVGGVFRDLPEVDWITGMPAALDEAGATVQVGPFPRWTRPRFLLGANRYIQQESTFWRRRLWDKAGARVDDSRTMASDFDLWLRFFRHARLYPVRARLGAFRHHADSLWVRNEEECLRLYDEMLSRELAEGNGHRLLRAAGRLSLWARRRAGVGPLWGKVVSALLASVPGPDRPRVVRHDAGRWVL